MDNGFEQTLQEEKQRANKHERKTPPLGYHRNASQRDTHPQSTQCWGFWDSVQWDSCPGKGREVPTQLSVPLPSGRQEAHIHRKTENVHSSLLDSRQRGPAPCASTGQPRPVTHAQWTIAEQPVPKLSVAA